MYAQDFRTFVTGRIISSTAQNANADLVYQVPDKQNASIDFISVVNSNNNNRDAYLEIFDSSEVNSDDGSGPDTRYYFLLNNFQIGGNKRQIVIDSNQVLHLHAGDQLRASASHSDQLYIVVSGRLVPEYLRNV